MVELNVEIENLINTSLFLSTKKKKALKKLLEVANKNEKKTILKILISEKDFMSKSFSNSLKVGGKQSLEVMDNLFAKAKSSIFIMHEGYDKKKDCKKMDDLLDKLKEA